jgi:hypothetical protein
MSTLRSIRLYPTETEFLSQYRMNNGDVFYDKDRKTLVLYDGQTKSGIPLLRADLENAETGLGVAVSANPPANSRSGSLWFDVTSGELFIYVDDGDSEQWVQPSGPIFAVTDSIAPTYVLPVASTNVLGGVRVDGTSITINNGVISAAQSSGNGGIDLTAFSVSTQNPSINSSLIYNNTTGVFTFTPPDLSNVASVGYVDQAIAQLVGSAPETLDTLNELAAALDEDPNFATTITTALGEKAPINNPTFTGTVSGVTATMVGLGNVTNESKATMFTSPTFTGTATLQQTVEVLNSISGATSGLVGHDFSTGAVWIHENILNNFTVNLINVPTTDNRAISVALILIQGSTPYIPNTILINGSAAAINWQDNIVPTGNANKRNLVSFTLLRFNGSWTVLGSLSTYG